MRTSAVAMLTLSALVGLLAGCGDDDGDGYGSGAAATASGPASPTPSATAGGQVASCVTGDWRSTGVSGQVGGDLADVEVSGGAEIMLTIAPDGAATLDFAKMAPVSFSGQVAGAEIVGEFTYAGEATGKISTDGDRSGTWRPAGSVDWAGVTVTVELTEPVRGRPVDDVPLGDFVEEADQRVGDVVDVEPMLSEGTYECRGGTLVLGASDGGGFTWTLARA